MKESRELAVDILLFFHPFNHFIFVVACDCIDKREDIAMPLTQMVPLFQRIFQSVNKELFVFRYLEADDTETKILDGM